MTQPMLQLEEKSTNGPSIGSKPRTFALIIAIDKYPADGGVTVLHGANADAQEMRNFLIQDVHVPEDHIQMLVDQQATKQAIESSLRGLVDKFQIQQGDAVIIFYAGHGAETNAPEGWASGDGKIQMLIPWDFRVNLAECSSLSPSDPLSGQGVIDITLSKLLHDMAIKIGDNITVILDSCHSGSATRDVGSITRRIELPANYRVSDALKSAADSTASSFSNGTRGVAVREEFRFVGLNSHVLLAACSHGQTAKETNNRGDFSRELLSLLRSGVLGDLSYKDIVERVGEKLSAQFPQCEGRNINRIIFTTKEARSKPPTYTLSTAKHKSFLNAGHAHSISVGAQFAIYADEGLQTFLGTLEASTVQPFETKMCHLKDGPEFPIPEKAFAIQSRAAQKDKLRLLVRMSRKYVGTLLEVRDRVRPRGNKLMFLTSADENPDLIMTIKHDKAQIELQDPLCREQGLIHIPNEVDRIDVDVDRLSIIIDSAAHFFWHLRCSSPANLKNFGFSCRRLVQVEDDSDDLGGPDDLDPSGPKKYEIDLVHGELFKDGKLVLDDDQDLAYGFEITNRTSVGLYAAVFYFDMGDLSITSFYEPGASGKNTDVSIEAKGKLHIGYGNSGTQPQTFFLNDRREVEVGYLKIYLATEYVDWSGIAQPTPFQKDIRGSKAVPKLIRPWFGTILIPVVIKPL